MIMPAEYSIKIVIFLSVRTYPRWMKCFPAIARKMTAVMSSMAVTIDIHDCGPRMLDVKGHLSLPAIW